MNDLSQTMNPPLGAAMMIHGPVMSQPPPPPVMVSQSQLFLGQSHVLNPHHPQLIGHPQLFSQSQVPVLSRSYEPWPPQPQPHLDTSMGKSRGSGKAAFGAQQTGWSNWKRKNSIDKRQGPRKVHRPAGGNAFIGGLRELQSQGRLPPRKFIPKKKFDNWSAPDAPRNTTSYIIRSKKSGGIASLVSPCPVTPSVLPTPVFSPTTEVLGRMAKEEWGVDGYGSMKGLIRLRGVFDNRIHDEYGDDEDNVDDNIGSGESDVEEEDNNVLSRLDHEMNRFEMVGPFYGVDYNNMLENRVHEQDAHISQLEEENLMLRDNMFLMEREMEDMRRRLHSLERQNHSEDVNEEVVENGYDNQSEEGSGANDVSKETRVEIVDCSGIDAEEENDDEGAENAGAMDTFMEERASEPEPREERKK